MLEFDEKIKLIKEGVFQMFKNKIMKIALCGAIATGVVGSLETIKPSQAAANTGNMCTEMNKKMFKSGATKSGNYRDYKKNCVTTNSIGQTSGFRVLEIGMGSNSSNLSFTKTKTNRKSNFGMVENMAGYNTTGGLQHILTFMHERYGSNGSTNGNESSFEITQGQTFTESNEARLWKTPVVFSKVTRDEYQIKMKTENGEEVQTFYQNEKRTGRDLIKFVLDAPATAGPLMNKVNESEKNGTLIDPYSIEILNRR